VITRALGAERTIAPDVVTRPLEPGDVILLCSDGLSSHVPDARIAAVLERSATLDEAAHALVDAANDAGGSDNVTVVLARIARADDVEGGGATARTPVPTVEEPRPEG